MKTLAVLQSGLGWTCGPQVVVAFLGICVGVSVIFKAVLFFMGRRPSSVWEAGPLATLGNASSLLGMLGTVSGLLYAMTRLRSGDPSTLQYLITGLATALLTTEFGIICAVGCSLCAVLAERLEDRLDYPREDGR